MMTRAQCSCCGKRMEGAVAPESYIYCDWCVMKFMRWLDSERLLDRNPLAVALGLHTHSKATNHSPVCWHLFLAQDAYNPSEYKRVEWPTAGAYSYESQMVSATPESIAFPKEPLDNL